MTAATRRTVSAIGTIVAIAGVEHGIGEVLQGNVAPEATSFPSWPESEAFRILAGEPAMTIVPNLLITGILAIASSLAFLAWATVWVERRHAGLVLIALSAVMLLVGAGFGPPVNGIAVGSVATRINSPLTWWRRHLPASLRRGLATLWPCLLGVDLAAWLAVLPGLLIVGALVDADAVPATLVYVPILLAVGLVLPTAVAAFARDIERGPTVSRGAPR